MAALLANHGAAGMPVCTLRGRARGEGVRGWQTGLDDRINQRRRKQRGRWTLTAGGQQPSTMATLPLFRQETGHTQRSGGRKQTAYYRRSSPLFPSFSFLLCPSLAGPHGACPGYRVGPCPRGRRRRRLRGRGGARAGRTPRVAGPRPQQHRRARCQGLHCMGPPLLCTGAPSRTGSMRPQYHWEYVLLFNLWITQKGSRPKPFS